MSILTCYDCNAYIDTDYVDPCWWDDKAFCDDDCQEQWYQRWVRGERARREAERDRPYLEWIEGMTHEQMAYKLRYGSPSHPIFKQRDRPVVYQAFKDKFERLGGMTPELSERLGYNRKNHDLKGNPKPGVFDDD